MHSDKATQSLKSSNPAIMLVAFGIAITMAFAIALYNNHLRDQHFIEEAQHLADKLALKAAPALSSNRLTELTQLTDLDQSNEHNLIAVLIYRLQNHQLVAGKMPHSQQLNSGKLIAKTAEVISTDDATAIGEVQVLLQPVGFDRGFIFILIGVTLLTFLLIVVSFFLAVKFRLLNPSQSVVNELSMPEETHSSSLQKADSLINTNVNSAAAPRVTTDKSPQQDLLESPSSDIPVAADDHAQTVILIVDDDRANRMVLSRSLDNKYQIIEAVDGKECLQILESQHVDLVLLDLMMPVMSGFDVLQHIQNHPQNHYPAVLVLSALMDSTTISNVLRLGAVDYLTKPFNVEEMLARINTQLSLAKREIALEKQVDKRTAELTAAKDKLEETFQQLLQSEKMASIGQLAAGVAHEVNNPIGFIYSNIASLQDYIRDLTHLIGLYRNLLSTETQSEDAQRQSLITEITDFQEQIDIDFLLQDMPDLMRDTRDGTERVKTIVMNLKHFSRMNDDQMALANINEGIEATLKIVWNELKYKTTVHKQLGDIPVTLCNLNQLNQVFTNLLVNAAHAIEEKGDINIETLMDKENIIIRISDNGKGIKPEHLNKLFEPFFTTKPVGQGTGLGLYLSYEIMQKHNGSIEVDSEPGKGTTFTLTLPIKQAS